MSTTEALHLSPTRHQSSRRQARHRPGQALPLGLVKLSCLIDSKFLRPNPLRPRRAPATGSSTGLPRPRSTPLLELPQTGRRRNHHGHALPLPATSSTKLLGEVSCVAPASLRTDLPTPAGMKSGKPWTTHTAEDSAFATFETKHRPVLCHFNSPWCTRRPPRRPFHSPDRRYLLSRCRRPLAIVSHPIPRRNPALCTWNPDIENPIKFHDTWAQGPTPPPADNAFKSEWELFLKHVLQNDPFRWNLLAGAKGVQLGEKGVESWEKRAWVDVPPLNQS